MAPRAVLVLLFAALVAALLPATTPSGSATATPGSAATAGSPTTPGSAVTAAAATSAAKQQTGQPAGNRAPNPAGNRTVPEELRPAAAKTAKGPSTPEKFEELPPQPSRGQKLRGTWWFPLPDSMQLPRPGDVAPRRAPDGPLPGSERAKDEHAPPLLQVFLQ